MNYTGLERHTDEELFRMAYGSNNRLAVELAKRLSDKNEDRVRRLRSHKVEKVPLAGVNPIPLSIGEEEE